MSLHHKNAVVVERWKSPIKIAYFPFDDIRSTSTECCSDYPGRTENREHLKTIFLENIITGMNNNNPWIGTDRFTVATHVVTSDEFIDNL